VLRLRPNDLVCYDTIVAHGRGNAVFVSCEYTAANGATEIVMRPMSGADFVDLSG